MVNEIQEVGVASTQFLRWEHLNCSLDTLRVPNARVQGGLGCKISSVLVDAVIIIQIHPQVPAPPPPPPHT